MANLKDKKNKVAGKMIAKMISYNRDIKKRDPHSYSSGVHQEKAIKEKYPKQYKSYFESPISKEKGKQGKFGL